MTNAGLRYFFIAGLFATFVVACELPGAALHGGSWCGVALEGAERDASCRRSGRLVGGHRLFWHQLDCSRGPSPGLLAHRMVRLRVQASPRRQEATEFLLAKPAGCRSRRALRIPLCLPRLGRTSRHLLAHARLVAGPRWGSACGSFAPTDPRLRQMAILIAAVSAVCLCFYLFMQPQENRNYGGMTAGLRWAFWFAPLWLVTMLPAADRCAERRCLRGAALVLLALSVLSASYPTWNPWSHPWILNFMHYMQWL